MMKTETILSFIGLTDEDETTKDEGVSEPNNRELFEAEMTEIFRELAVQHSDTQEFSNSVKNLETLTNAYNNYERAMSERNRNDVECEKLRKERWIKVWDVAPRCVGLVASFGLTGLMFLVEQQHPVANRLVNKANDFLTRP